MNESTHLRLMKEAGKGYRSESYSGSGVRNLYDIILHEFEELNNLDILVYMEKNHGFDVWKAARNAFEGDDRGFDCYCLGMASRLKEQGVELSVYNVIEDIFLQSPQKFAEELTKFIEAKTGRTRLQGLWLATKMSVENYYQADASTIDCYEIKPDAFVISDLGPDGTLFVMEELCRK